MLRNVLCSPLAVGWRTIHNVVDSFIVMLSGVRCRRLTAPPAGGNLQAGCIFQKRRRRLAVVAVPWQGDLGVDVWWRGIRATLRRRRMSVSRVQQHV